MIYYASILAALMLARGEDILGFDTQGIVAQATDRDLEAQRGDGAWPYGEGPKLNWVDNHHTGLRAVFVSSCPRRQPAIRRSTKVMSPGLPDRCKKERSSDPGVSIP